MAHSCGCKSRRKLITASEVKRAFSAFSGDSTPISPQPALPRRGGSDSPKLIVVLRSEGDNSGGNCEDSKATSAGSAPDFPRPRRFRLPAAFRGQYTHFSPAGICEAWWAFSGDSTPISPQPALPRRGGSDSPRLIVVLRSEGDNSGVNCEDSKSRSAGSAPSFPPAKDGPDDPRIPGRFGFRGQYTHFSTAGFAEARRE